MSCSVFNRGLDFAILYEILNFAKNEGLLKIYSSINKNSKNKYVHHLHELLGFKLINKNDNRYNYVYNLNDALKEKNNESQPRHYIKICK